jgi:hypothetical protein
VNCAPPPRCRWETLLRESNTLNFNRQPLSLARLWSDGAALTTLFGPFVLSVFLTLGSPLSLWQEVFSLWFAWFLIVSIEGWAIDHTEHNESVLFSAIFEICSA